MGNVSIGYGKIGLFGGHTQTGNKVTLFQMVVGVAVPAQKVDCEWL
jgi:hypothetical protein